MVIIGREFFNNCVYVQKHEKRVTNNASKNILNDTQDDLRISYASDRLLWKLKERRYVVSFYANGDSSVYWTVSELFS